MLLKVSKYSSVEIIVVSEEKFCLSFKDVWVCAIIGQEPDCVSGVDNRQKDDTSHNDEHNDSKFEQQHA